MTINENPVAGQPGHLADHAAIAVELNNLNTAGRQIGCWKVKNYSAVAVTTTAADAIGLAGNATVGEFGLRPLMFDAFIPICTVAGAAAFQVQIYQAGVLLFAQNSPTSSGAATLGGVRCMYPYDEDDGLTAGEFAYKVQVRTTASTGTMSSLTTGPAYFRIWEC